jgi:hypothetical protein
LKEGSMKFLRKLLASALTLGILQIALPVQAGNTGYSVKDAGGSVDAKTGDDLHLSVNSELITITKKKNVVVQFKPDAVTDISFGQEVHRRIGTAAALAVVSLGRVHSSPSPNRKRTS